MNNLGAITGETFLGKNMKLNGWKDLPQFYISITASRSKRSTKVCLYYII